MPITDFFATQIDAIKSAGASYQIQGDPVVALLAQLNRFVGRSVRIGTCDPQNPTLMPARFQGQKFPLDPRILDSFQVTYPGTDISVASVVADAAINIVRQRYLCVAPDFYDNRAALWTLGREVCEIVEAPQAAWWSFGTVKPPERRCRTVYDSMDRFAEMAWLKQNLRRVVETIAQVGDAAGLPPAEAGITEPDPALTPPKKKYGPFIIAGVGLLAVAGALAFTRRRSRALPAAI